MHFLREYRDNKDGYVKLICEKMIPAVSKQGIAKFNDVFCEKGFFNENQSIKILTVGKNMVSYQGFMQMSSPIQMELKLQIS